MRIAVLGAGAMGSWFGGQLANQGYAVELLTTNKPHREEISTNGLVLRFVDQELSVSLPALGPEDITTPVDLILLFTKSFQSYDAMSSVAHAIGKKTHVLSLQNGLGNAETIARFVPQDRVWIGVSMMPVDKISPGIVACKGSGKSYFGSSDSSSKSNQHPIAQRIVQAFKSTGMDVEHDLDIHQRIWEKVAFNAGMNALTALTHGRPGSIGISPGARELARDVAVEVAEVAKTQDVTVQLNNVFDMIDLSCEKHADHVPSMLQDLLSKRKTEVDALNGAVANIAKKSAVAAPLNKMLATLVRLAEISHQKYD